MMSRSYIVATDRLWNMKAYHDVISTRPHRSGASAIVT